MSTPTGQQVAEMSAEEKQDFWRTLVQGDVGAAAAARAPMGLGLPTNEFMARPLRVEGRRPFQWAPAARGAALQLGAAATADLSHLLDGSDSMVLASPGARLVAGRGRTFLGTDGQMATAGRKAALRVMRIGDEVILQEVTPAALSYGPAPRLQHDVRFVCGGQSNMSLMEDRGGWGGFSAALARGLEGARNLSVSFVNGATGGTAIDRRSVRGDSEGYWWDAEAAAPGPSLLAFYDALDAGLADGQDLPLRCFWTQGESDANALQNRRMSPAQMTQTVLAVWDHIWARHPGMVFIVNMIGGYDYLAAERGTNAARAAYLQAIAAREKAHQGIEMYDLQRDWLDIHYQYGGYAIAGGRMAAHLLNLDYGAQNALGPRVTAATLQPDRTSAILTIDWGRAQICPPPQVLLQDRRPYGIYMLAPGSDPSQQPLDLAAARFLGRDLLVRSKHDMSGCFLGGPYGCCVEARRGQILHDMSFNNFSGDRGLPLRSFLMKIT
ncbi:hypothetical protein [Poseidonocella sp. HB161398]|uniref:hypothetical protein n=1 Tax=Poseidonocella sp. HB161398 TaxID=2320855 RepID=UPI001107C0B9|nr:hypothetical protein [Poseidonocella sp. HB161398]